MVNFSPKLVRTYQHTVENRVITMAPFAKLESENGTLKVHQIIWLNVSFAQFLAHIINILHAVISIVIAKPIDF